MIVGVDTGGTFTDLVALLPDGRIITHKLLSTPSRPEVAFIQGLDELTAKVHEPSVKAHEPSVSEASSPSASGSTLLTHLVHGSTVATNAVLERKGARTAWVTSAGFRDILHIGRQQRRALYDLTPTVPAPLIPRESCFEINERVAADGSILTPLSREEVIRLAQELVSSGVESVALLFLHSYEWPDHEKEAAAVLRDAGLSVYPSHEILPEYREYERGSTTALNAYVSPIVSRYLKRLQPLLAERTAPNLKVMQSSGGVADAADVERRGVHTIYSGPAGGVIGAQLVAAAAGAGRVITYDMGGTSTDVSLVPGEVMVTTESEVEGYPMRAPAIDIRTVGAGGGSIAYVDDGGALRVGPESAGARPGPAAYGHGGGRLTVTDANVVLGRIPSDWFLGGRMRLDEAAAHRVCARLARQLGAGPEETALAVLQVASANMERAIRAISAERGHDPHDFSLVAYGGAGPLHAGMIARNLEIPRVLIPPFAGLLSALGVAVADVVKTYSQGVIRRLDEESTSALQEVADRLTARAHAALADEGFAPGARTVRLFADVRYARQSYELTIETATVSATRLIQAFHREHMLRYGYDRPDESVEVTALRVRGEGRTRKPEWPPLPPQREKPRPLGTTPVVFEEFGPRRKITTPIFDRRTLGAGALISGPAIIASQEATVLVPAESRCTVHETGTLLIDV